MTVRNSSDSLRHLNSSSTTEGTDYDTTSPDTQTDYSHQQRNINETERSEGKSIPNYNYSNRGIPTAEIIGSSVKKISRSESRSESVKKASKLPRVSPKTVLELKGEKREEVKSPPSLDGVLDPPISQGQPRRNSLERPSFYNSLYKNGLRSYSGSMSRSVNLPSDHSLNGDPPSDTPTLTGSEHLTKLDKYLSSRINNGESSMSDYDFHTVRPFSTLGRSYSMKGPAAATKSYDTLKTPKTSSVETDIEGKYSHSPSTITRVSSLKENNRLSSRFLRPKSFYGATDLTNYQGLQSSSPAESIKPSVDLHSERKSAFVSRKSPSYQRSISVFEGKKAEEYHRSLSVTPERSVLGKYLSDKKSENNTEKSSIDVNNEKPKTRKISRFLRPDFYDTPKEESVYVKKDKDKTSTNRQKKSSKKLQSDDVKNQENRLSIVDKAIKSLKEKSLSKNDHESMARESNLIKRAVSLEDCSLVPESRTRRSSSLTPQTYTEKKYNTEKVEKIFQKKKVEDFKKIVDNKLNTKNKELTVETPPHKEDCMIKKLARKLSPKNKVKPKPLNNTDEQPSGCNGSLNTIDSSVVEDSGVSVQDTRSRLSRIAGLKRLEFTHPLPSADSTPSIDESKLSGELDDSSSFLSPTEDCSDTWSVSSDYADAREFITPPTNEDSVSERIRRKSFYSRFNQSKRKKSSQSTQAGSRSRLPMYSKSMSSDFSNVSLSKVVRKISDPEAPVDN